MVLLMKITTIMKNDIKRNNNINYMIYYDI